MSVPEITNTGITIQTFDDIFEELVDGYKGIYGTDINLAQESPDGQRVAIEAKARLDMQAYALALYNSFDPDLATGLSIEKIGKLSGIYRRPATRSQVDLTITADRTIALASGYQVQDTLGQIWETTSDIILVSGANTVTVFSQTFGAVTASAGTITEPVDVEIGIVSVTNASDATVGVAEETDVKFRQKRASSLELPAQSTLGSILSNILAVANVTDAVAYENDTDTYNATTDINAHTIWIVVEGGDVADIAETMTKQKTAGTATKGSVTQTYDETITRPDGSTFTITHTMNFDRPNSVDIYVNITATRKDAGVPVDTVLIAQKIAAYEFSIGESLQAGFLYSNGYEAGNNFILTDLEISDDDITYTDGRIEAGLNDKFTIDSANVTVTEVI